MKYGKRVGRVKNVRIHNIKTKLTHGRPRSFDDEKQTRNKGTYTFKTSHDKTIHVKGV